MVAEIKTGWVLKLLKKYPTAEKIASARALDKIEHVTAEKANRVQAAAKDSVAALTGDIVEELVRTQVEQLQESIQAEKDWKKLLGAAFDQLPDGPHRQLETIKGIGKLTAAAIVATAIDIGRFPTADHLVGYYGIFPEEVSSGVDKFGRPHPAGKKRMCRKGNDLVRGLLFNCAKSASQEHGGNPAVRKLYLRLLGKGVRKDVAFGYCMTKRAPIADRRIGRTRYSASGPRAKPSTPSTKRNEKRLRKEPTLPKKKPQSKKVPRKTPRAVKSKAPQVRRSPRQLLA